MAVAKQGTGGNAGGLTVYLMGTTDHNGLMRPRADVVGGTMAGRTASELAGELNDMRELRPGLGQHLMHTSIRFAPEDRDLTDAEQAEIGRRWADGMGYEVYAVISHGDHIHIPASRITLDGGVVSDSHNYRRSEEILRGIERDFGLRQVESSHLLEPERATDHRKSISQAEIGAAERGEHLVKEDLANMIEGLLNEGITATEFVDRLTEQGVDVRPNIASTGKLNGFSYGYGETSWTAKQLGRGFTLANMTKRGFDYEPGRDGERLREAKQRSEERSNPGSERAAPGGGRDHGEGAERERDPAVGAEIHDGPSAGEAGGVAAADGRGARGTDQEEPGDIGRDGAAREADDREPGSADRSDQGADQEAVVAVDAGDGATEAAVGEGAPSGDGARGDAPSAEGGASAPVAPSRPRGGAGGGGGGAGSSHGDADVAEGLTGDTFQDLIAFFKRWAAAMKKAYPKLSIPSPGSYTPPPGSAYDRIQALAGTGKHNLTRRLIAQQLAAFGSTHYECQLLPNKGSGVKEKGLHRLTAEQVLNNSAYYAAQNAKDFNVQIRPAPIRRMVNGEEQVFAPPYLFIDDLDEAKVNLLEKHGLPLAIKIESSTANFHGWVRVAVEPVPASIMTRAASILAKAIGADKGAADWRHFGRLAGYTNRKPERRTEKGPPYAKLTTDTGHPVAKHGPALLSAARKQISAEEAKRAADAELQARLSAERRARAQATGRVARDVVDVVAEARERYHKPDASAADFSAALSALRRGYDRDAVADALRVVSPALAERHPNVDDYLERTLDNAEKVIGQASPAGPRR